MLIRKWILWGFFGLLVINILVGCYGLIMMEDELFGPAIGSCVFIAIGCLLLYPASWLSLVKHCRHVSCLAMGWLVVLCVLSVAFCWVLDRRSLGFGFGLEEFVGIPLLFCIPAGLLLMLGTYLRAFDFLRLAGLVLNASVVVFMGMLLLAVYFHEIARSYSLGNTLLEICVLIGFVGVGLPILLAGYMRWYKPVGILATLVGSVMIMLEITGAFRLSMDSIWIPVSSLILAVSLAYYNLVSLFPLKIQWTRWLRLAALILLVVGGGMLLMVAIWPYEFRAHDDAIFMFVSMLGFVIVCITFVLGFKVAADHIKIRRTDLPSQFNYSQLQITCPHCQTAQLLTEAGQHCCSCGMQFHFRITEPHCPNCEYLLIGQSTGNCPECGHPLSENIGQRLETS